jgi:quercetin dioxygenase-like cupin family protein
MSSALPDTIPFIAAPGAGKVVRAFGAELTFHLTGEQTGGRLMVATILAPVGDPGPPPHYHENEDETFLVQEGRMSFFLDGEWRDVAPGTIVFAPKGKVHTLRNIGDTPARVLVSAAPSGFEVFFTKCSEEFAKPGGPNMARINAISAEHGIHYVNP